MESKSNEVGGPRDQIYLGFCSSYPAPGIIERVGADWDWIWLDGQHGQIPGYDTMLSMVRACNFVKVPAYLRVPGNDPVWISLGLDMAADAIIVPQVDTVEQALRAVRAGKFPPLGNRSYGGRRVIDLQGRDFSDDANTKTRIICQIESTEAVENAEAIAAIDGVDGLFFGPDDWVLRQGLPMTNRDNTVLIPAIKRVANACRANGKDCFAPGMGAEATAMLAEIGVNYIVAGSDVPFLAVTSKSASAASRDAANGVIREASVSLPTSTY